MNYSLQQLMDRAGLAGAVSWLCIVSAHILAGNTALAEDMLITGAFFGAAFLTVFLSASLALAGVDAVKWYRSRGESA